MADTEKQQHRQLLAPLLGVLAARFNERLKRPNERRVDYKRIADVAGLAYASTQRILSRSTTSPDYVSLTKLIVAAGLSPNEGAKLAGLWEEPASPRRGKAERQVVVEGVEADPLVRSEFETLRHLLFEELTPNVAANVVLHARMLAQSFKNVAATEGPDYSPFVLTARRGNVD